MVIETKIRFEAGSVIITQTFGPGKTSPPFKTDAGDPADPLPAGKPEEEGELGVSYETHGGASTAGIVAAAKKKDDKGGETDRPDTGGGANSGGLTIVFGSLITDCGTVLQVSAQTGSTGKDKS